MKAPAGTTIISGHWLHSLNASPGLSAHSSVEDSGAVVRGDADPGVNPPPHPSEGIGDTVGGATTASLGGAASEPGGVAVAASLRNSSSRARAIEAYGVPPNWRMKSSNTAMLVEFC